MNDPSTPINISGAHVDDVIIDYIRRGYTIDDISEVVNKSRYYIRALLQQEFEDPE